MSVETETPARAAHVSRRDRFVSRFSRLWRTRKRPDTPAGVERKRIIRERRAPLYSALNGVKTVVAVFVWLVMGGFHVTALAPYVSYIYAQAALSGMAVSCAILLHLWPTRTPQWRTLFWMFWITLLVGASLLLMGAGRMALTGATLAGFGFAVLRMGQNGRRLVRLIRDWRDLG